MSSRKDEKARLREEREAREAKQDASSANRKRLGALAGVAAAAVVVVVALILLNGGGDDKDGPKGASSSGGSGQVAGAASVKSLIGGIPQEGERLGNPKAPVTLVQYVDLQCPFCGQYSTTVLPELIQKYVRTGKVQIQQRTVEILGGDSQTAATWAAAAADKNKLFEFSEIFYRNQGQENTGYVTSSFLNKIASAAGLNAAATAKASTSAASSTTVKKADAALQAGGFDSTPSFALGRTGRDPQPLQVSQLQLQEFTGPIDKLLGSGQS